MARISLSNESFLLAVVKAASALADFLPLWWTLSLARVVGRVGYYCLPKKRAVMYANLRQVYAGVKSPPEIRRLSRQVFSNFAQSCVEILSFRKIERLGLRRLIKVHGEQYVSEALARGKGVIFLAVHSGNWELASLVAGEGRVYHIVANLQSKMPRLAALLDEYRTLAGSKVISPGTATRDIIRALRKNEIITLVIDQGGDEGMPVKFLGRTAAMATGAMRLGLKYGTTIIPAWITRESEGHDFHFLPPLDLSVSGDLEQAVQEVTIRSAQVYSRLVYNHPQEYMWFYKVFKYSTESNVLILDDGKTGHLRQSQTVGGILRSTLTARGKSVHEHTVALNFKTSLAAKAFGLYAFFAQFLGVLCREEALILFLTPECYQALLKVRADYIVSCGSVGGGLSYFLSRCYNAKTICVLTAGLVSLDEFDLVIMPAHDRGKKPLKIPVVLTRLALNLVTPEYLKAQGELLFHRYSHLRNNTRAKIGVLLGGSAKGVVFSETQARSLLRQLKEAAHHFNVDLLVTTSRRTAPATDALVARELKNFERCPLCIIANENNIPEAVGAILALSDLLIVSGESISMVSEAVSSGKPTIVFPITGHYAKDEDLNKYDRFVLDLNEGGHVLACAIKDISFAISDMMRHKVVLTAVDDRAAVKDAVAKLIGVPS